MVEENNTYEGTTLVALENYERTEGVWKGTKKEEYTFEGGQKTKVLTYQWYGNAWIYQFKEEWTFTSGRQTLYEKHGWNGAEWIAMQRDVAAFDEAGNQTLVENYGLYQDGWKGTKKEEYIYNANNEDGTRLGLIAVLEEMRGYLTTDNDEDKVLKEHTDAALKLLREMTDAQFDVLDLTVDFPS